MVFYFTGTGNSGYAARRIADGLGEPLLCLNDRIKAGDTAPVETGERLVIVTPTYAWRIPRIVEDWLLHTELTGAKRAWFVMTCGSEIGDADRYNRRLCQAKSLAFMGGTDRHAGELHCHVQRPSGGGGPADRGQSGAGHRRRDRRRPGKPGLSPVPPQAL